ncbi:ABC transporter substrate-binding protein [Propioniciclava coleopterorum]|uniref:Lipoprotein n=2 Tax=Propioniciclava coleopterorum TaxID=2714937 RepID=A0A6G7Y2I2_9ACTN|nr:ABC transporter substrate-binding protein [Propioniciclava coleopterorum]
MFRRLITTVAALVTTGLVMTGCGAANAGAPDPSKPLRIMADVTPHALLLKEAEKQGLLGDVKIQVTEISGDIDPNQLVNAGDLDANFFQHVPYLTDWNAKHSGADLVALAPIHVEPLGLYSKKAKLDAVPEGAVIAIPADATNQARALFLLQDAGLITLDVKADQPGLDYSQITPEKNVTGNPKNVGWLKIDRPQLAATLDDPKVQLSVINGNYALEAGLTPATDALALESAENNPYANVLVVKAGLKDDPRVKKVDEALTSPQLRQFITDTFKGSVLPAEGSGK